MPKTFLDLPVSLRLHIFRFALKAQRQPRDVEIFLKDDKMYSNTPPPALLHVSRESRYVTLMFYKPWLPQYEGTAAHKPWVGTDIENASSLENVCIDLKRDTFVLRGRITTILRLLGPLERNHLRLVAINVWDMLEIGPLAHSLRSLKSLKYIRLFGVEDSGGLGYKKIQLARYLLKEQENGDMKPKAGADYFPPVIYSQATLPSLILLPQTHQWTTYKYPIDYKHHNDVRTGLIGEEGESLQPIESKRHKESNQNASLKRKVLTILGPRKKQHRRRSNSGKYLPNDPIPASMNQNSDEEGAGNIHQAPDLKPRSTSRSSSADISDQVVSQLQLDIDNAKMPRGSQPTSNDEEEADDGNALSGAAQPETGISHPNASTDGQEDSPEWVIEKFMGERHTPQGLEILVQWKDYPREEDWTWETSESLAQSVPEMIEEWHSRADFQAESENEEEKVDINVVERIVRRQVFNRVPYYLVEWEGYPKVEDRTWELAERLKADVPFLVNEFTRNERRKERRRHRGSGAKCTIGR